MIVVSRPFVVVAKSGLRFVVFYAFLSLGGLAQRQRNRNDRSMVSTALFKTDRHPLPKAEKLFSDAEAGVFFLLSAILFHFRLSEWFGYAAWWWNRESVSYLVWFALVINFYPTAQPFPYHSDPQFYAMSPMRRGSVFC